MIFRHMTEPITQVFLTMLQHSEGSLFYLCSSSGVQLQDVIVLLNLMLEVEAMMYHVFAHIAFVGMLVA